MKKIKDYIVPTIILFVICFVSAGLLGLTNEVTKGKIAENDKVAALEAMQAVMPGCEFSDTKEAGNGSYAVATKNGEVVGYAITATGKGGYDGEITLMVGVNADGTVAKMLNDKGDETAAIKFLDFSETPSVGGKLKSNINFLMQFVGLKDSAALSKNGGTVDAVTGATKTSTGITDAVNNALACYNEIAKEAEING